MQKMHSQTRRKASRGGLALAGWVVVVLGGGPAWAGERPDDLLIIGHRDLKGESISKAELKQIFLRQRGAWNGTNVVPVNAKPGTEARKQFRKSVLEMNPSDETRYWQESKIRTGKQEPPSFKRPLLAAFKVRGAISYLRRAIYRKGAAKVLLVIPAKSK